MRSASRSARPSPRDRGAIGEATFISAAIRRSLAVSTPFTAERYDFIVASGPRLFRVQVKTVSVRRPDIPRSWCINLRRGHRPCPYSPADADILAAYILPLDLWYIIPIRALRGVKTIAFFPEVRNSRSRWEPYREAWRHFFSE
jgi:hypothetical protein